MHGHDDAAAVTLNPKPLKLKENAETLKPKFFQTLEPLEHQTLRVQVVLVYCFWYLKRP